MNERPFNNRDRAFLLLNDLESNVMEFCKAQSLETAARNCGDTDYPDLSPAYDRIQAERDKIISQILSYVRE